MKKYNLPKSWDKMNFSQRQYYLVDTFQAKNLSVAAKIITKQTNEAMRAVLRAAVIPQMWYMKET